ncbi:ribosomal large subunit pseudouridine synthase B [Magnetococcus marinus MC-1]|uniref:Pseudouridine synthase n=1 Tax=Magnetococcus marinus (strain ATCC BAA-1437 / JCM 17883 / MC-1) TaxID=156889 RepID=A0L6G3_MAGMM|nr:pseudouridine synthase [Magnetococcus marinus]ABK43556.1 ribosomal large subunit pseudouridine synthase B [Magnetococcus marinus MC-1]
MSQAKSRRKKRVVSCSTGSCATNTGGPKRSSGGAVHKGKGSTTAKSRNVAPRAAGTVRAAGSPRVIGEAPRLQKWLAEQGLCSRREGEVWIQEGRVSINGEVVTELGVKVAKRDRVAVDGQLVTPQRSRDTAIILHKPKSIICTRSDPQGRRTIFDLIENHGSSRLITVGRLDINSEGLIILTSDGQLAHGLMHPSREVPRVYRVKTHGILLASQLEQIRTVGVRLEDGPTGPLEIVLDRGREQGNNSWYTITLREGRNREVRRIFDHFGLQVARLLRVGYGGISLGNLEPGAWRPVTVDEWNMLQKISKRPIPGESAQAIPERGGGQDDEA